jgi:hypothetical protein
LQCEATKDFLITAINQGQVTGSFTTVFVVLNFFCDALEDMFRPYLDLSKAGLKSYWPW